jgi:hypothetical protein
MSDYELFYNAIDPDKEYGWYWRIRGGNPWTECGAFATIDQARADAEKTLAKLDRQYFNKLDA